MDYTLKDFVTESNRIEDITRPVTRIELEATKKFLALPELTVKDLQDLVGAYTAGQVHRAVLRDRNGLNVSIGGYYPPSGGPEVRQDLQQLLNLVNGREISSYDAHLAYEKLHPFTDGNGRSGRAVWLWQQRVAPIGFLHAFYYQTLRNSSR